MCWTNLDKAGEVVVMLKERMAEGLEKRMAVMLEKGRVAVILEKGRIVVILEKGGIVVTENGTTRLMVWKGMVVVLWKVGPVSEPDISLSL